MEFIFAPDSFKGTLSAQKITEILKQIALKHFPKAEIHSVPVADGGEGTVDALLAALGGEKVNMEVMGPLGDSVNAFYGMLPDGQTAVIEMAQASGLPLVPDSLRDPRNTTTYGTGELMRNALERGATKLLIGIGGSATNDGGMGMLSALGARFLNNQGETLRPIGSNLLHVAEIDVSNMMQLPTGDDLTVICDVTNPLLGKQGAAYIYGPQKGATPEICEELDVGMRHYASIMEKNDRV